MPQLRIHSLLLAALVETACASSPKPAPASSRPTPQPSAASAAAPSTPPLAPVRNVTETYFGTSIVDPYRWMESSSLEMDAWMKGQADYARHILDAIPQQAELRARVHALNDVSTQISYAERHGARLFYMRRDPGEQVFKLCVRDSMDAPERVLFDPARGSSPGQTYSIDYFRPSPDGKLVAIGLSLNGSEMAVLHVLDSADGHELSDVIDRARWAQVSWQPDGRAFFYTRLRALPSDASESERLIKAPVFLHTIGTSPDADVAVFGYGVSPSIPVAADETVNVWSPKSSRYVFAFVSQGVRNEATVYSVRRDAIAGAATPWKKIIDVSDDITTIDVHGDALFLMSHHGAPRFKVLQTSVSKPDIAHAATLAAESSAVIRNIMVAKDALYLQLLDAGLARLERVPYNTRARSKVELPVAGTLDDLYADDDAPGVLFQLTSWTLSPRLFSYEPTSPQVRDTGVIQPSPVDFASIQAQEVLVPAADGTRVPLSIIERPQPAAAGPRPALLQAYGAYGNVAAPRFDPMLLAWLERGAVYAVCHPRGGGEFGEGWHESGMLANKTNTISDVLSCAQYLVDQGLTSAALLAVEGTSAGGIAAGGAITQRPELFGAAVIRVGMSNMLRMEQIPIGPLNTAEFGTLQTEAGFKMLLASDAYAHVKEGTTYPAVLLTTGITDPRVSPWQAAKMAARLQAANAQHRPVLLRVDYEVGHGVGSSKARIEAERADKYAFLLSQLGAAQ